MGRFHKTEQGRKLIRCVKSNVDEGKDKDVNIVVPQGYKTLLDQLDATLTSLKLEGSNLTIQLSE